MNRSGFAQIRRVVAISCAPLRDLTCVRHRIPLSETLDGDDDDPIGGDADLMWGATGRGFICSSGRRTVYGHRSSNTFVLVLLFLRLMRFTDVLMAESLFAFLLEGFLDFCQPSSSS